MTENTKVFNAALEHRPRTETLLNLSFADFYFVV